VKDALRPSPITTPVDGVDVVAVDERALGEVAVKLSQELPEQDASVTPSATAWYSTQHSNMKQPAVT
jgi:hypothetical protein